MSQNLFSFIRSAKSKRSADKKEAIVLQIKSGLLAGSERDLEKDHFIVGSGSDADIILLDDGISPIHFAVTVTRSLLGTSLAVQALDVGVMMDGNLLEVDEVVTAHEEAIVVVHGVELAFIDGKAHTPIKVSTGDTAAERLGIEIDPDAGQDERTKYKPHMFMAAGSMLCLSVGIIMFALSLGETREPPTVFQVPPPSNIVKVNFELSLKEQVEKAGLADILKVRAIDKHSLEVSGDLPKLHSARWTSILRWYDGQEQFPSLVNRVVEAADEADLPKMRYVWFGKRPYIMLQNKQKVSPGDVLYTGFKLQRIHPGGIIMTSSNRQYEIKFN